MKNRTLTCVLTGNNPRFPRTNYCALHHQTDVQARNTTDGSGSTGNTLKSILHQQKQRSGSPIQSGPASRPANWGSPPKFRPHGGAERA